MTEPMNGEPGRAPIEGVLFDGQSSRAHPATLEPGEFPTLRWGGETLTLAPTDVRVLPGVGRARRAAVLRRAGGELRFESDDAAGMDALERALGGGGLQGRLHRLERRRGAAVVALALTVLTVGLASTVGLTALAGAAAARTPPGWTARLDAEVRPLLEEQAGMGPTGLSPARQAALARTFAELSAGRGNYAYNLQLRASDLGPNALALPGGTVYLTDELVALLTPEQVEAVMAHEIAHVVNRDGTVAAYRALGLLAVVTVLTGDLVSSTTVAAALPIVLLQNGYSRRAEFAADAFAADVMRERHGSGAAMVGALERLEAELGGPERGGLLNHLQTHPPTGERIARLRALP